MSYQMPNPEEVVANLRTMAAEHSLAFAHSVVCRQAADEIERLRSKLRTFKTEALSDFYARNPHDAPHGSD